MKPTFLLIAAALCLGGCKKGEDDPFFSLRSRKARLAGEWTLESSSLHTVANHSDGATENISIEFSDGTHTLTNIYTSANGESTTLTDVDHYTEHLSIEKNGNFTWEHHEDGEHTTMSGKWEFLDKDKDAGLKNKEAILLKPTSYTENGEELVVNTMPDEYNTYVLRELRNKKMVWEQSISKSDVGSSNERHQTHTWSQD